MYEMGEQLERVILAGVQTVCFLYLVLKRECFSDILYN